MEPIVVGTDGSPRADVAVEWAAEEAGRTGRPCTFSTPPNAGPATCPSTRRPACPSPSPRPADRILTAAVERALKTRPDIDVTTELVHESPAEALRAAAGRAHEVVLGHRGSRRHRGTAARVHGAEGRRSASGPVIIVRGGTEETCGEVVVGVDRTGESALALRYAFEAAAIRGAWVRAVHVWECRRARSSGPTRRPSARAPRRPRNAWPGWSLPGGSGTPTSESSSRRRPDIGSASSSRAPPPRTCWSSARGPTATAGTASDLGSVSHGVIHHSHCPVAVVRARP